MRESNIPNKILKWYDNNKRNLPWRKITSTKNREYFTLVSEFMLQQTQVKTVIPYFETFIKNFPNLKSLANANEQRVLKNWEGLGYYSRARNLKKTALKLSEEFNGNLPKDVEKLKSLPGIGEYTSRSILAIAHNQPYIPMDGNVERILKRVFLLKTKNEISKENLIKKKSFFNTSKRSSDYAQAIMEIGALVCKPVLPSCDLCPLTQNCKAYKRKDFLIKSKNKFNKTKYFEANVYKHKNKYLLIKNKKFNFLKNLVIFPMNEINKEKFKLSINKKINVKMSNMNMKIIINKNNKKKMIKDSLLLDKSNINKYILPSFTKKIFNSLSHF
jgi:A/G-specific adenine glycosylase|tara:strand:+ start:3586 stop:4575 length:990 start_codon:yes stop_codon:yes gene_type:complete